MAIIALLNALSMRAIFFSFLVLLSSTCGFSADPSSQITEHETVVYVPPFAQVIVDTTEWTIPYEIPFFLDFFQASEFKSKKDNTTISIECKHDGRSIAEREKKLPDYYAFLKPEFNIGSFKAASFWGGKNLKYFLELENGFHIEVITNTPQNDNVIKFVKKISRIKPQAIDEFVGYPFDTKTDYNSLRDLRKSQFKRVAFSSLEWKQAHLGQLSASRTDSILFEDILTGFSFRRYFDLWQKAAMENISEEECLNFLIHSDTKRSPLNLLYRHEGKELVENIVFTKYAQCRAKHGDFPYHSFQVIQKADKGNTAWILFAADTIWNLTGLEYKNEKWLRTEHTGRADYMTAYGFSWDKMKHESTWESLVHFPLKGDSTHIVLKSKLPNKIYEKENLPFDEIRLFESNRPQNPPILFKAPSNYNTYKSYITLYNSEIILRGSKSFSKITSELEKNNLKLIYTLQNCHLSREELKTILATNPQGEQFNLLASEPKESRLYTSPLMITDLDKDSNSEYWITYVSNGQIVLTDMYEISNGKIDAIATTQKWNELIKNNQIVSFMVELSLETMRHLNNYDIRLKELTAWRESRNSNDVRPVEAIDEPNYRVEDPSVTGVYPFSALKDKPMFQGGEEALKKYLKNNLVYPKYEKNKRIQGTITIYCSIGVDGTITPGSINKDIYEGPNLQSEARRLILNMPKWIPGKKDGKAVITRDFPLSIAFKLD